MCNYLLLFKEKALKLSFGQMRPKLAGHKNHAQISKVNAFQFQRRKISKLVCFVPMFHLVTPGAGPVLTPKASNKQT